jgi:hypothetical protein
MKIKWDGYEACMGEMRNPYKILVRKPKPDDPGTNWNIILKWILGKYGGKMNGYICLRTGTSGKLFRTVLNIQVLYVTGNF